MALKFKKESADRLEKEFHNDMDPRLRAMVLEIERWMFKKFGKDVTITSIMRTQEEQDRYYADKIKAGECEIINGVKHYRNKSVHQYGRGCDLRTWGYTDEEIKALDGYIEKWFPYGRGKQALIHHNIGLGEHIHLQVPGEIGAG